MEVLDELVQAASTEIAEYSRTEAALADLRARMANVEYDVITVKGMAVAKADRAEVRGLRTSLEATRKQIKAPALAHCKLIDAEAARITTELLKLETPIDEQIKAREAVVEAEKAAKEAAERARITDIHKRIATIREFVALAAGCRTAARVDDLLTKLSLTTLADFEEFADEAAAAHLDAMERVAAILAEKTEQEAEQARIKAEQAEAAAKLAAERTAFEAAQAKAMAEADRLESERQARIALAVAAHEAKQADDKAKADAEAANVAAERATFEAEQARISKANRDAAIAEADRLATERQRLADERADFEAQMAEVKRAAAKAKQDRIDAETPQTPAPELVPELAPAPVSIAQAAIETAALAWVPSDADLMWIAICAVAKEYGMTTEQATARLAAIKWSL